MGTDKALLCVGKETLLERALRTAAAVADRVLIVGPRERYVRYGDVVEDVFPGCGPLAGIHSALYNTNTELNLMLSVDMPLMSPEFLTWLLDEARARSQLIVVPQALGGSQPLAAVYRRAVRAVAEQSLMDGHYKIGHMFALVPTRYVTEAEILAAGFSPEVFRNVNTFEEYEDLVQKKGAFEVRGDGE
jgi:molybdopterin-guanine dinucleotide biosynthesis protein A